MQRSGRETDSALCVATLDEGRAVCLGMENPVLENYSFDAEYLARLRARDAETLAHFCDYFRLPIRNKVRHSWRGDSPDDLVQDVFVAVLERIDAGEPREPAKLPGYVLVICRNLLIKKWSNKNRPDDADVTSFADAGKSPEAALLQKTEAASVRRIVRKLMDRDREALERVFFDGEDRETAARKMGISKENLRVILCRALQRFRREWDMAQ